MVVLTKMKRDNYNSYKPSRNGRVKRRNSVDKKNLLSIGELSKITGVHVKALRYYDSIGILTPVYVDPDSGYRYYSFYQKEEVDAIQFCVELGIPLKEFPNYVNKTAPWICYNDLVRQGAELLEKKIQNLQQRLSRLKAMQAEIERSECSFRSDHPEKYVLSERFCWLAPYTGTLDCEEANKLIQKITLDIYDAGLELGNINGLLLLNENKTWKQYLFVEVFGDTDKLMMQSGIFHIPSGNYLCRKVEKSGITKVWDWCSPYLVENEVELVIESELFLGNYVFSKPILEQRCLLKAKNH